MTGNREAENQLTTLLYQTYAAQKAYGDKAEMMEMRDTMFLKVLGQYTYKQVHAAFIQHISNKPEIPTPSDIKLLIDPLPPKPDRAVYQGICDKIKNQQWVSEKERDYLRYCEQYTVSQMPDK